MFGRKTTGPVLFAISLLPVALAGEARADEKAESPTGSTRTVVPLSVVARHYLQDFQKHRAGELKRLGDSAAWRKGLDPVTFDRQKSWAAFVALAGGKQDRPTEDDLIAEIALLYHLAAQDDQELVLEAKLTPKEKMPTDATVRLARRGRPVQAKVPYHGLVTLSIGPKIDDNEMPKNGRMLWNRVSLDVRADVGPFRRTRNVDSPRVWFGLRGGKEAPLKANQVPIMLTTTDDSGKYEGGGVWSYSTAGGKSSWATTRWAEEMVPTGRWKKR